MSATCSLSRLQVSRPAGQPSAFAASASFGETPCRPGGLRRHNLCQLCTFSASLDETAPAFEHCQLQCFAAHAADTTAKSSLQVHPPDTCTLHGRPRRLCVHFRVLVQSITRCACRPGCCHNSLSQPGLKAEQVNDRCPHGSCMPVFLRSS